MGDASDLTVSENEQIKSICGFMTKSEKASFKKRDRKKFTPQQLPLRHWDKQP